MSEIKAFAVVDKDGIVDGLFEDRDEAERAAAADDLRFKDYAPHTVIELTGTLPRKPETREVWAVMETDGHLYFCSDKGKAQRLAAKRDAEHRTGPHRVFTGTLTEVLK